MRLEESEQTQASGEDFLIQFLLSKDSDSFVPPPIRSFHEQGIYFNSQCWHKCPRAGYMNHDTKYHLVITWPPSRTPFETEVQSWKIDCSCLTFSLLRRQWQWDTVVFTAVSKFIVNHFFALPKIERPKWESSILSLRRDSDSQSFILLVPT